MFKKIKNNKIKNTGIIFLILVKSITLLIINNSLNTNALKCFKKIFNKNSLMYKLWLLYKTLTNKQAVLLHANVTLLINNILLKRKKYINLNILNILKYNAIKYIKNHYDMKLFFNIQILNYRQHASIYKIFLSVNKIYLYDPILILLNKKIILNNLMSEVTKRLLKAIDLNVLILLKQPKLIRLLANLMMIKNFNKKYLNLSNKQKLLLRLYIHKNTDKKNFYNEFKKLTKLSSTVLHKLADKKKETLDLILYKKINNMLLIILLKIINGKRITLNNVKMLMNMLLLIKEIKLI